MSIDKIAVFMKEYSLDVSLPLANTMLVFKRDDDKWMNIEKFYVNLSAGLSIEQLRAEIRRIAEKLGTCRIAAGYQISGIIYRELDKMGFSIFEITHCSEEILDGILRDVEEANASGSAAEGGAEKPAQTDTPGVYFFDLQRLQKEKPDISSKQALREFFDTVPFYELHLVCAHIPPWLKNGMYDIREENTEDGKTIAVIRNKQCGGGLK